VKKRKRPNPAEPVSGQRTCKRCGGALRLIVSPPDLLNIAFTRRQARTVLSALRFAENLELDENRRVRYRAARSAFEMWVGKEVGDMGDMIERARELDGAEKTGKPHVLDCDEAHEHRAPKCCSARCWCRRGSEQDD